MSTNETKLESARQELRKLPAEWRTTYANYITLCNLREQFTEVFITEVRRKTDDPLKPGVNAASFVAAIENNMFGRIAAINTLVGVVEKLPEFAEASAAVGKAIGKVKAAEAAVLADKEEFMRAEAELAAAEAEFILEAKQQFEAKKAATIQSDPRFQQLRSAVETAAAKVGK